MALPTHRKTSGSAAAGAPDAIATPNIAKLANFSRIATFPQKPGAIAPRAMDGSQAGIMVMRRDFLSPLRGGRAPPPEALKLLDQLIISPVDNQDCGLVPDPSRLARVNACGHEISHQ